MKTEKQKQNRRTQENFWRWWLCLLPCLWWWSHKCIHTSNLPKLYTLILCRFFVHQLYLDKAGKNLINLLRVNSMGILNIKWDAICISDVTFISESVNIDSSPNPNARVHFSTVQRTEGLQAQPCRVLKASSGKRRSNPSSCWAIVSPILTEVKPS